MNDRARRYAKLLWAYPKLYRRERGDEIVGTLLEASTKHGDRPAVRDVIDLATHGVKLRFTLIGDRIVRPVLAWLFAFVTCIVAVGLLFVFVDLLVTGIRSGNIYRYESMVIALALFGGVALLAFRALKRIRRRKGAQV
jgi:hypothetical protein